MRESIMMKEIRRAKDELSEQAKKMSRDEFLDYIKKESESAKKMTENTIAMK